MRNVRRISASIVLLLALAAVAWASQSWKNKPYQQWNKKDVSKVMNDSPWEKTDRVSADWKTKVLTSSEEVTGSPSEYGGSNASMNGPAGLGMEPRQGSAKFEARWISAKTMREAMLRQGELEGKVTPAMAQRELARTPADYQIFISGKDMTPFSKLEDADVAKVSYLQPDRPKGKLSPVNVKFDRSPNGTRVIGVVLSFPKTLNGKPTIAANAHHVELVCKLKGALLRFRFDASKMIGKGGRDL